MAKSSVWPQVLAALSASLSMLCVGFHFGWPVPTLPKLYEDTDLGIEISQFSWIVSVLFFGCVCGAIPAFILVDIVGRKITLLLTTLPFVISSVIIVFARRWFVFCVARFIAGIGIGVSFTVAPMYIGEIAEARIRGSLCVLMPIMMQIGHFGTTMIGPWIARAALGIVGATIPIIFATSLIWLPESPYYYSMKKNRNETRKSLTWLRALAVFGKLEDTVSNESGLRWLPLVGLVGFIFSYSIGLGTLPIVVAGEIFPCEVKAFGLALHTVIYFVFEIGVAMLFNFAAYHLAIYINLGIFAVCSLVSTILIFLILPETKGRSLSEIQAGFQNHFGAQT